MFHIRRFDYLDFSCISSLSEFIPKKTNHASHEFIHDSQSWWIGDKHKQQELNVCMCLCVLTVQRDRWLLRNKFPLNERCLGLHLSVSATVTFDWRCCQRLFWFERGAFLSHFRLAGWSNTLRWPKEIGNNLSIFRRHLGIILRTSNRSNLTYTSQTANRYIDMRLCTAIY